MAAAQYWTLFFNQRFECHVIPYLSHTHCPKKRGHMWNLVSETLTYSSVVDCLAIKSGHAALIIQWESNSGDRPQTKQEDCNGKCWDISNRVGVVPLHWVSEASICYLQSPIQQEHQERLKAFFGYRQRKCLRNKHTSSKAGKETMVIQGKGNKA